MGAIEMIQRCARYQRNFSGAYDGQYVPLWSVRSDEMSLILIGVKYDLNPGVCEDEGDKYGTR